MLSRLMLEAMREAERDPTLRERMGAMLGEYRRLMVETVRADQELGAVFDGAPAAAIATLLGAVGDGLLLHALLDPELSAARPRVACGRACNDEFSGACGLKEVIVAYYV